jgi:cephalosporin hydroxylase
MTLTKFKKEVESNIKKLSQNKNLIESTKIWFQRSLLNKYSYNFSSYSVPIIQYPQDMIAIQELIWEIKPDLIIETGIAHGGSIIQSASILAMIEYQEAVLSNSFLNPAKPHRKVLGIDIDIRKHNKKIIDAHFLSERIDMIEGSSVSEKVIKSVYKYAKAYSKILVLLDSNHTHEHVLAELKAYTPLVTKNSYCIVYDTNIDDLPKKQFPDRSWGPGNNPKTAVHQFLKLLKKDVLVGVDGNKLKFKINKRIEAKLQITVAPDGYLKRI